MTAAAGTAPESPEEAEPVHPRALSVREFVPLMATIVSLGALSIDAMLPALPEIADELGAKHPNDAQLVISMMFLGFSLGQLIYGPASDSFGRKRTIYLGMLLFLAGCALSYFATDFEWMLVGRVLQGVGAAAARIVSMALIRDQYSGDAMARIMSLIMAVFILVPALAPAIGQGILMVAHWRGIFALLLVQALVGLVWLAARQPETLPTEQRSSFRIGSLWHRMREVFRHRTTVGYTVVYGLVFANFIVFLTTSPQLFMDLFAIDESFPLYFGALALCVGVSSVLNARFVGRWGMRAMVLGSLTWMALWAIGFLGVAHFAYAGKPPLAVLMVYLAATFFCMGGLLGNLNALAMQPVGHVAGMAAAFIGALSTAIALVFGTLLGRSYSGTVYPLVLGFAVLGAAAWVMVRRLNARSKSEASGQES